MNHLLAVGIGGALGSILRFISAQGVQQWLGKGFPYGTLFVNVVGSFIIGILFVVFTQKFEVGAEWRALLMIGFLGGFTTFSSFSLETMLLIESGDWVRALTNIAASVALCLIATALGFWIAKQF